MLTPMTKLQIVGRKGELEHALEELHVLGVAELIEATDERLERHEYDSEHRDELRFLVAEADAVLALLPAGEEPPGTPVSAAVDTVPGAVDTDVLRRQLDDARGSGTPDGRARSGRSNPQRERPRDRRRAAYPRGG